MDGPEKFSTIRQIRSNPSIKDVAKDMRTAIEGGMQLLASHEPIIKEVHDAFTELAERVEEAQDTLAVVYSLQAQQKPDQEEVNSILRGAVQTRAALLKAILLAKHEVEK